MIPPIPYLILLTALTGMGGLALGGALAALPKKGAPSAGALAPVTAGVMLAVVFFHMLPEALEHGSWLLAAPLAVPCEVGAPSP